MPSKHLGELPISTMTRYQTGKKEKASMPELHRIAKFVSVTLVLAAAAAVIALNLIPRHSAALANGAGWDGTQVSLTAAPGGAGWDGPVIPLNVTEQ